MSVAAVVVTYNRVELLMACLEALRAQSVPLDEVFVVDNGSTDGTPEQVRARFPDATLCCTGENLGGAGGFAVGVDLALRAGHEAAWLMDDDGAPERDALEHLLVVVRSDRRPAFVAATVLDPEGRPLEDHAASSLSSGRAASLVIEGEEVLQSDHATFVGVLVSLGAARRTALPLADYFLWFDDNEYTRRIGRFGPGYYVTASRMVHPRKVRTRDVGDRIYYAVRNSIWTARTLEARADGLSLRYLRDAGMAAAAQLIYGRHRRRSAVRIVAAVRDGVTKRPRPVAVGGALRALDERSAVPR